jgi:NADPH:quinone reductase-like Zn-dependent oxidoreductase
MRAVISEQYGGPEALAMRDVPVPSIGQHDVLLRVRAAGLHVGDAFGMRGSPFLVRVSSGLRRPKSGVPGLDVAGVVEAVGPAVTALAPGDEVFGLCAWPSTGACAEYTRAPEAALARKPEAISFVTAAALPTSAFAALNGLRAGGVQSGTHVLVNGASGAVGTFAVQVARAMGAEVTAVCGPSNAELVRELGAHHVIDYTREDFTRGPARYDVILDNIENHPLGAVRRVLTPDGTLVCNSGTGASGLAFMVRLVRPVLLDPFVKHHLKRPLSTPKRADLEELARMVTDGSLRPVVERTWTLEETADALRRIEGGHSRGKVVVTVG